MRAPRALPGGRLDAHDWRSYFRTGPYRFSFRAAMRGGRTVVALCPAVSRQAHSYLSASIGLMRAARRAGTYAARNVTAITIGTTIASAVKSR